eukprot:TRINITY_DN18422_c0_g1_i1.p1 TRINITY_DN18422_c0_g1~~TRINITY_DN18422_c0_g1_i1.p1  ORF type:complete len:1140 (+),score=223.95 TRINITY_DN18422_c0_g1_i1:38-3457(+)
MHGFKEGHLRARTPQDCVSSQYVSPPRNALLPKRFPKAANSIALTPEGTAHDETAPPWLTPTHDETADLVMSKLHSHYLASTPVQSTPLRRTPVQSTVSRVPRTAPKTRAPNTEAHPLPNSQTKLPPFLSSSRGLHIVNKAQKAALGRLAVAEEELRLLLSSEGISNSALHDSSAPPGKRIADAKAALEELNKAKAPVKDAGDVQQEVCMLDFVSESTQPGSCTDKAVFEEATTVEPTHSKEPIQSINIKLEGRQHEPIRSSQQNVHQQEEPAGKLVKLEHKQEFYAVPLGVQQIAPEQIQVVPAEQPIPLEEVSKTSRRSAPAPQAPVAPEQIRTECQREAPIQVEAAHFPIKHVSVSSSTCEMSQRGSLMSVTFLDGTLPQDTRTHDCTVRLIFDDPNQSLGVKWRYNNGYIVADSFDENGVCDKAGMQKGWCVVSVNKIPVCTIQHLNKAVSDARCEQEWVDLGVLVPHSAEGKPEMKDTAIECAAEVADIAVSTDVPYPNEDYENLTGRLEELQTVLNVALKERDDFASKVEMTAGIAEEYSLEKEKCTELQLLLDNCNEMLASHERIAEECKNDNAGQEQFILTLEDEKRKLEHQVKMSEHNTQEVVDKYELLQRRIQLLETDLEMANRRCQSQKQHIEFLEDDLSKLRKAESDLTRKLNSTSGDLEGAKDLVKQFQGNTELLVAENEEKTKSLATTKHEMAKITRESNECKRLHDKVTFQSNEQSIALVQADEEVERQKVIISTLEAALRDHELRSVEQAQHMRDVVERNALLEAEIGKIQSAAADERQGTVRRLTNAAEERLSTMQSTHDREVSFQRQELDQMRESGTNEMKIKEELEREVLVLKDEKQVLLSKLGAYEAEAFERMRSPKAKRLSSRMVSPLSPSLGARIASSSIDDLESPYSRGKQSVYFLDNVHPPDDGSCDEVWTPVRLNVVAANYGKFRSSSDFARSSFARSRTASWRSGELFMDTRIVPHPVDGFMVTRDSAVTQVPNDEPTGDSGFPPVAPSPESIEKSEPDNQQPTPNRPTNPLQQAGLTLDEVFSTCFEQRTQLASSFATLDVLKTEMVSTKELLSRPSTACMLDDTVWQELTDIEQIYLSLKGSLEGCSETFDKNELEARELAIIADSLGSCA